MKRIGLLFSSLAFIVSLVKSQQLTQNLEAYTNSFGQERVYLHYDKSSYAPAETVWFKAYLMQGIFPAEISKTLYVDWTDESGKLLLHASGPILNGTSIGQFEIPAEYSGRFLRVKAYTRWMLNFDSAFLYQHDLRILSKSSGAKSPARTALIQFFPEGGDLVANVFNKIAFKANDQYGMPVKVSGTVNDHTGKEVAKLNAVHDGMGVFLLRPVAGEKYVAKWKDEKGKSFTDELPGVKADGYALQVVPSASSQVFSIRSADSTVSSTLHIVGTMYQHPVFNVTKTLEHGATSASVPTAELPSGIMTISVFDENWRLLNERITFVNNHEYEFKPEFVVEHWGLNKRARNEIEISVPPEIVSSMSVSVTDLNIDADSSENIISSLLLTGELRGKVFNPAWYFTGDENKSSELDLVMLTNGWRRIAWEKIMSNTPPDRAYGRDTAYLTLSGRVYGATPVQLRNAGTIILLVNKGDDGKDMLTVDLNPDGTFRDAGTLLFDSANVYYQLPKDKGLDGAIVKFMEDRLPAFKTNAKASGIYASSYFDTAGDARHRELAQQLAELTSRYQGKVLETVKITAPSTDPVAVLDKKYASGLFSRGDAYQFDIINDIQARGVSDIFFYLQGKIPGLQINTTSNPPTLAWRGSSPDLFLNEIKTDASMISNMVVSDIAYIKVFRPPFMGSIGGGAGGAIAVYTRKGGDVVPVQGKGLPSNTVTGYTQIKEFYSPNYSSFSQDDDKPDIRTTLYWNPSATTAPNEDKVQLSFYNNDITHAFRVVIEGMTKDGKLAHVEQTME